MPRYTNQQIADALRETNGMVYLASQYLGCAPKTVRYRVRSSPELQEIVEALQGAGTDTAELALYNAVLRGESWAVQFYLKTKGKDRGYTERSEQQIDVVIHREAKRIADEFGLDPAALVAEAERILAGDQT